MVAYYEVVVILVLVCCCSLLPSCTCARQVEFKYNKGDQGPYRLNYVPQGYNNHDGMSMTGLQGMSMTEKHLEVHTMATASEFDLSSVPRKLLVESAEMKKSHENNNKKLSGDSSEHERQKDVVGSFSSKNVVAVPWHRPPPPSKDDHRPTFHVDYSGPRTHPPKNNR